MIDIAVIYPSRGLLFTETLKELLEELTDSKALYTIYWSHGNKLPACFNKPLERALRASHTHILFLEDDMMIKKGVLKELIDADEDIISCDYPIVEAPSGTVLYDQDDNALFTGTGFMLAKRHVFNDMPKPIFRSDLEWAFKQYGDKVKFTVKDVNPDKVYGHHDITFGLYQYLNNKPIKVAKTVLAQRKLKKKGENSNNKGADEIILYDRYRKINFYMIAEEKVEEDNSKLVSVELDGKIVNVTRKMASKLIKDFDAIKPTVLENGNLIVDINGNKKALNALRRMK